MQFLLDWRAAKSAALCRQIFYLIFHASIRRTLPNSMESEITNCAKRADQLNGHIRRAGINPNCWYMIAKASDVLARAARAGDLAPTRCPL